MGLRGIGARTKKQREEQSIDVARMEIPWTFPDLKTRADRVIAFCEDLTVTSGSDTGKKLRLRKFQKDFLKAVYKVGKKNIRQVRTAILSMARKNGKTQLAAALALCHLAGPEAESRGEVYACANDRFQAGKLYNEMEAMVHKHPWLDARINISKFTKSMTDMVSGSIYVTLTSEAKTKMGLSPSFVVYDELGQSTTRELYDAMDSAMGARKEPLMLVISTQAADNAAPLSHLIDYGQRVLNKDIDDPAFHLTLYTTPDDADPWDKKSWELANPALGDFRSLEDVERLAGQAQRIPAQENAFRNLILNQRVAAETRFMEPSSWKACGGEAIIPPGHPVYAGLDLGSTRDLTAFVIARHDMETGIWHVKPWVWVPGNLKERGEQDGVPYEAWAKQELIIPAGPATDPRVVARLIAKVNGINPILGLAFDRWRIEILKRDLGEIGCGNIPLIEHGQGFKDMSPAVDCVERFVVQKNLRHGGNPILTWCAANAVVIRDPAGSRKFDKSQTAYRSKIDALVAMAMALSAGAVKERAKVVDIETLIA